MGHWISGLVGERGRLARIATEWVLNPSAELEQGFGFLPLDDENLDRLLALSGTGIRLVYDGDDREDGDAFEYLTPSLIGWCSAQSRGGRLAYVETQYFGGAGGQGAAVFDNGALIWGPAMDGHSRPIGEALRLLGVTHTQGRHDLFESVGLDRHRDNDDWREWPHLTDKPDWRR